MQTDLEAVAARDQRIQDADRAWDLIVSMYSGCLGTVGGKKEAVAKQAEWSVDIAFAILTTYNAKREAYVGPPVEPK